MTEPLQYNHQQQYPFRGDQNRSCSHSGNYNDDRRNMGGSNRRNAGGSNRRNNDISHRPGKKSARRERKRREAEIRQNRRDQDRWGGSRKVYNERRGRDRGRMYFLNENSNAKRRGDHRHHGERDAKQSNDNYQQNNGNYQENRDGPLDRGDNRTENVHVAAEQPPLPQKEYSKNVEPRKTYFSENSEPTTENITSTNVVENVALPNVGAVKDVVLNIKTEKKDNESQKAKSSSSSSSDSDESSSDSAIKRLHNVVNSVLSTNPPKKPHQPKICIKKEKPSSSSSSSSNSSSHSDTETQKTTPAKTTPAKTTPAKTAPAKTAPANTAPATTASAKTVGAKKSSSEEEVICLGRMERKENLVDDEDEDMPLPMEDEKVCFLCEEPGHVAFQCFMVCKNCNEKYHGLRNCPKPPNISLVLQFFMQFCMDQACKYNPSNKFSIDGFQQINPQIFSNFQGSTESMANNSTNRKRRNSNDAGSSVSKASRRRREDSSTEESESSSDENIKRKAKRRSKSISDFDVQPQMSFTPAAYSAALPFAFNPSAMGMNPAMNPLLALGQMMGYNSPSIKRTGKSKKK